jgi:hypothetical protein
MTANWQTDIPLLAATVRGTSASTEASFLEIAQRLEKTGHLVASLTATFDALSSELRGDSLRQANADLCGIADRLAALIQARSTAVGALVQLGTLGTTIQGRIARMAKSVGGIGMLATNARIAVAHINDTTMDLGSFAGEIKQTLQTAQTSLDGFGAELAGLGRQVRGAVATQSALEAQEAAIRTIPERIGESVAAISVRSQRAAAAALAVAQGAKRIEHRIGDAIMSLQIGDTTRQRIEHGEYAQSQFAALLPIDQGSGDALGGFVCRLQAAQLGETADRFDNEIRQIQKSVQDLADASQEILRLGQDTFGASNREGSFLGELADEVASVDQMLAGFRSARQDGMQVMASVLASTARLMVHIGSVRSLEANIRIMGLNMSFKCGRLGTAGRPLSIVAQELRVYAKEIAAEATAAISDLDAVAAIAGSMSHGTQGDDQGDIAAIADGMAHSMECLRVVEQRLAAALVVLERDGRAFATLMDDTAEASRHYDEVGLRLRAAASELDGLARDTPDERPLTSPQADPLLDLIMRSYTMEAERALLARLAPWRPYQAAEAAPPRTEALEDVFF